MVRIDHLIAGAWVPSASGERFETSDPHDGRALGEVAAGGPEDARRAVAAARAAFDAGHWPRMSTADRRRILHAFAEAVEADGEHLALLDTHDMGKPIRESRTLDVPRVARNLRFFADYADMAGSEAYPDG